MYPVNARMQQIEKLIEGLDARLLGEEFATTISSVVQHSDRVKHGSLFVARSGTRRDGACFIDDALNKGAVAVVCTPEVASSLANRKVAIIETYNPCKVGAVISERFHGNPSSKLKLIGVTGTNGKTTVSWLIHHILKESNMKCGLLGTIVCDDGIDSQNSTLTTPSFCDIGCILHSMVDNGCVAAVMECSSHALDQGRVAALNFDIGVFTNLSGDHLDYHGSVDSYLQAKMKLFNNVKDTAVINMDDPAGWTVADCAKANVISCRLESDTANAWVEIVEEKLDGSHVCLHGNWGTIEVVLPLLGRHNAINALQAVAVAYQLGLSPELIKNALSSAIPPPGRLERVRSEKAAIFVDFAHTDDALEKMLWSVREILPEGGKLHVVFGCGGDRDKSKRPRMGKVASTIGDVAYATSDNPRSEDPELILDEVICGVPSDRLPLVHRIADRKSAIQTAVNSACECDIVVIAGKGHEKNQILKDSVIPFDDVLVAEEAAKGSIE
ncbi:MAG: UDP-N-acetylmuramoyl-L-alanyl-D-glutamate--2,6-diaminopimelate ligase [Phycisphaerales bacterium]|jgi:UDP-N-acetylmuramyl-tripeptide synthetase|nr:UDP-N-acetylmuramoyl-L-alanyl-D-glutamate--2,6-diaminopimelate ligase [Phycisphaerales bacterium]